MGVFSKYVAAYSKMVAGLVRGQVKAWAASVDVSVVVGVVVFLGGMGAVGATVYYGLLTPYLQWIASLGLWGNLLMVLSFIPVSAPFVMGYTPLTLATGYIYGLYGGFVTSSIGAVLGACVAFYGTRMLCRDALRRKLNASPKFRGFMHAVESHGFKIIILMRLVPIPFGIQNGAFAVSNVSFGRYFVATALGVIPGQIMINYFGTTIHSLSDIMSGKHEFSEWQTYVLYSQGLVVAFLFVFVGYLSKRAMAYADMDDENASAPEHRTPPVDASYRPRPRHLKESSDEPVHAFDDGLDSGVLSQHAPLDSNKGFLTFDYAHRARGSLVEGTRVLRTTSNSNISLTVAHHHPRP